MDREPVAYQRELARRRAEYIAWIADNFTALETGMVASDGRLWALNHARLVLGRDLQRANRYFETFTLTQDSDICFIRALKTLLDFGPSHRLSDAARKHLTGLLTSWPQTPLSSVARWPALHTENHDLMHLTIGMFAQQALGNNVSAHVREIDQSLVWRFQRGWGEWNSPCYQFHYLNPLIVLAEHAPCPALRAKARDLFNVLLAERIVLGIGGYLGGPAFRCRTADATDSLTNHKVAYLEDNRYDGFLPTVWLALGVGEARFDFDHARVVDLEPAGAEYASGNEPRLKQDEGMFFACSRLQPHPVLVALAEEVRAQPRVVYEGRRYLGWPEDEAWATQRWLPGAIHYFNTPHVSLGSLHSSGWSHQTRYCNVLFAADPSQNLRVEKPLPGVKPDRRRHEVIGQVVQHRSWLLGQGVLFEDGGVTATRMGDWCVYRVGRGLCAHFRLPDDYHVLQVSDLDTYSDVQSFVRALSTPVMVQGRVLGVTLDGDRVMVDTANMSISVNGRPRPHPPIMLHDCGLMRSEYGSGRITITTEAASVVFDGNSPLWPSCRGSGDEVS